MTKSYRLARLTSKVSLSPPAEKYGRSRKNTLTEQLSDKKVVFRLVQRRTAVIRNDFVTQYRNLSYDLKIGQFWPRNSWNVLWRWKVASVTLVSACKGRYYRRYYLSSIVMCSIDQNYIRQTIPQLIGSSIANCSTVMTTELWWCRPLISRVVDK